MKKPHSGNYGRDIAGDPSSSLLRFAQSFVLRMTGSGGHLAVEVSYEASWLRSFSRFAVTIPRMEPSPVAKKPIGVTASAVLALLGSFLMLGGCVLGAIAFSLSPTRQPIPPEARLGMFIGLGMCLFLGIWGTTTAIGLLRMRNWGRISILIFSALLAFTGFVTAPAILLISPPNAPENYDFVRRIMAAFYVAIGLLGVLWLYYFNRRATREAFTAGVAPVSGGRPLSIAIIGWWFLIVGVLSVLLAPLRMPVTLFLWVPTGWAAAAYYVIFGGIWAYCGYGLLRLNPTARLVAIVLLCFGLVNAAVFSGFPGADTRMTNLVSNYGYGVTLPPTHSHFMQFVLLAGLAVVAVPLWFLIRTKPAFQQATTIVS